MKVIYNTKWRNYTLSFGYLTKVNYQLEVYLDLIFVNSNHIPLNIIFKRVSYIPK